MKILPGLPTMAALMLSALIAIWLGLWGPIDVQKLKDWQPLMASIIAFGAATLVYRGAMAKVNLDREEAERQRNREPRYIENNYEILFRPDRRDGGCVMSVRI
jgi:hypothetical protein